MDRVDMTLQQANPLERLVALVTRISARLTPSMDGILVSGQIAALRKRSTTNVTAERLVPSVDPLVFHQVLSSLETLVAQSAGIRPVILVHPLMLAEHALTSEHLLANWTLKQLGIMALLVMSPQLGVFHEASRAFRALEVPSSFRVDLRVIVESVF